MAFKRSSFEPHPEGMTVGTFVDFNDEDGQFGPQIRLDFDTTEEMDDGRPFRVCFWITESFNPKSNSYKFFKAMGVDVDNITDDDLANLELDDFIGKKCNLVIEHAKRPDGSVKAKVANLLPVRERKARAAAATPAQEPAMAGAAAGGGGGKWEDGDD